MKKISWYLCLLLASSVVLLSCDDDDANKEDHPELSLEYVSDDVTSASLEVKNFTMTDSYTTTNDYTFYVIEYSFEIHNKTDKAITLNDYVLQNTLASENLKYGAGGYLTDITIPAGGYYTVTYEANSSMAPDPLQIDDWHLLIYLYTTSANDYLIKLDYQVDLD